MKKAFLLYGILITGCQTAPYVSETVYLDSSENKTSLIKNSSEIGNKVDSYSIPVMVENPKDATLNIRFKIKSTGHCLTSYEPTVFYLNGAIIKEFDFRRYFLKKEINAEIKLEKALFRKGQNIFKIETGACQYDIDSLNLNKLMLVY